MAVAFRERHERVHHPGFGELASDDLDDLHHRHGIEVVVARDAARSLARGGHRGHRKGRRVRREDAVLAHDCLERAEQFAFRLEALDDRFDDDMRGLERFEGAYHLDASEGGRHVGRLQAALFGELAERLGDRILGGLGRARFSVENQGANAALREDLHDAAPHRAAADDGADEVAALHIEHGTILRRPGAIIAAACESIRRRIVRSSRTL
jgi:hypothetical protein